MFANPKKSGRCNIIDGYGDDICKASGEYERDAIFKCITTHDQHVQHIAELECCMRELVSQFDGEFSNEYDYIVIREAKKLLEQSK